MNPIELGRLTKILESEWNAFKQQATVSQVTSLEQLFLQHHQALFGSSTISVSEFSLVHGALNASLEADIQQLVAKLAGKDQLVKDFSKVLSDGGILGTGKYELLDIGWLETVIVFIRYFFKQRNFPTPGVWMAVPNKFNLAVLGDWGGGVWTDNNVASTIADFICNELKPDITMHLGDVYYAGEKNDEQDYLLDLWPTASLANFTLNSNHEMYPKGEGYFETALKDAIFEAQQGKSYFALENDHWILVGLDTAFFASSADMFMSGVIDETQKNFLAEVAIKGKPVVVFSHHNPLDITGSETNALWDQVIDILGESLRYWYWGHLHAGAVYSSLKGVNGRVVGHGVIPWGDASALADQCESSVLWYENTPPLVADGLRVQNGFALLSFSDETLEEAFYGEDGRQHWSSVTS